jgi:hypothetical protein
MTATLTEPAAAATTAPDTTPPPAAPAPGTDVAVADVSRGAMIGASLSAKLRYAETLSDSGLLPVAYRGKPANVLVATEFGIMLGIAPMAAINGIHIIEGKPTISPALMTALVRKAGHKVRIRKTGTVAGGDIACTVQIIRSDDPDFVFEATWDLERAERAGLCRVEQSPDGRTRVIATDSKNRPAPWQKYTEAMLQARATGEVAREAAEDCLCGVHYTPEELGMWVDEDGVIVQQEADPITDVDLIGEVENAKVAGLTARSRQPMLDLYQRFGGDRLEATVLTVTGPDGTETLINAKEYVVQAGKDLVAAIEALADTTGATSTDQPTMEPAGPPPVSTAVEDVVDAEVVDAFPNDTPAATTDAPGETPAAAPRERNDVRDRALLRDELKGHAGILGKQPSIYTKPLLTLTGAATIADVSVADMAAWTITERRPQIVNALRGKGQATRAERLAAQPAEPIVWADVMADGREDSPRP